ncbi:hypothetical protein D3C78_1117350 [compost metagenome]
MLNLHQPEESLDGDKISAGTVSGKQLAAESVDAVHLTAGSVTQEKLAKNSVGTEQLLAGSITADKLAPGILEELSLRADLDQSVQISGSSSIGNYPIQPNSIELSALQFTPVLTSSRSGIVTQQFGLAPYSFEAQVEQIELVLHFDDPFSDCNYVLTVTADHPACYAVIQSKSADQATVRVIRTRFGQEPSGSINWIALGRV